MKYIAIDFETANSERNSVCEIGIAVVEDSIITENFALLVKPKNNYFDSYNTYLHGIDENKVANEPEFDKIWTKVKHYFIGNKMIAHNAEYDFSVLRHVLDLYNIEYPELDYSCTYQISRRELKGLFSYKLNSVCEFLDINLEHHRAKSDAKACAEIAINAFSKNNLQNFTDIEKVFNLKIGKLNRDGYSPALTKHKRRKYHKISDIQFDKTKADENNIFYGANVVFTGKLNHLIRKEAQQKILEIGGNCTTGITKQTNFLILGDQNYITYGNGFKRSKIKKAEKLLAEGQDIELLSEKQFLELI